jgi:hypothetical protein
LRGEDPVDAAQRLAWDEVGLLPLDEPQFEGYYSDVFETSAANERDGIHTVSLVFSMSVDPRSPVTLDSQSSAYKWADELPRRFQNNLKVL